MFGFVEEKEDKYYTWSIANKIKILYESGKRYLICPYCFKKVDRSIIPHFKIVHPEEWEKWVKDFVYL